MLLIYILLLKVHNGVLIPSLAVTKDESCRNEFPEAYVSKTIRDHVSVNE